jgi:hypothetical protein
MGQRLVLGLLVLAAVVCAQRRVDPKFTYHRVICVVPFTSSGTASDPKRPKYAPWPLPAVVNRMPVTPANPIQPGIIGFSYVPSDDGKLAIVEFVARERAAFQPLFADSSLTIFEKGVATDASIEGSLQQYRKGFRLDQFGTVMP